MAKFITEMNIVTHQDILFVFGDNLQKFGRGGQAGVCRGNHNTAGVPTKIFPSMSKESFFNDQQFNSNKFHIDEAIKMIQTRLPNFSRLYIFPNIGEGLAKLDIKAPITYKYLTDKLNELKQLPCYTKELK